MALKSAPPPTYGPAGAGTSPPQPEPAATQILAPQTAPIARQPALGLARRVVRFWPAYLLGALVLGLWQLVTASGAVSELYLPLPASVARSFWLALTDGTLVSFGLVTIEESLLGFALAVAVGVPLGYLIARHDLIARALEPYLAASQAIPAVALAPLLVIWIGFGIPPVAALCALIVFFPTVVTTTLGIRGLDREILDAARVDGASQWPLLRRVELPLALPSILAGMRASLTLSITGAVVGEFVIGDQGLGGLLNIARGQGTNSSLVFATLLTLMLLAAALYLIARLVERRLSYLEAD
jgi:NitT/TauT family transport system permease protein